MYEYIYEQVMYSYVYVQMRSFIFDDILYFWLDQTDNFAPELEWRFFAIQNGYTVCIRATSAKYVPT